MGERERQRERQSKVGKLLIILKEREFGERTESDRYEMYQIGNN